MIESEKYAAKIYEVCTEDILHDKKTVIKIIDALISEFTNQELTYFTEQIKKSVKLKYTYEGDDKPAYEVKNHFDDFGLYEISNESIDLVLNENIKTVQSSYRLLITVCSLAQFALDCG